MGTSDGRPRVALFSGGWVEQGAQLMLGASDYWRVALPAAELLANGWDVIFARSVAADDNGTLHVQDPLGEWHGDRDIIIWQRWMGEGAAEYVARARETGQVVINDVDDHYWALPGEHYALQGTDPDLHPLFNREHYRESVAASSLITVATEWLGHELKSWGPPVRVIRNYMSLDNWPSPWLPGAHIGWIGAMPWRGNDLELLQETVIPWLREQGKFFYHGGQVPGTRTAVEILGYDRVSTRPAVSIWEYPALWDPLRIALIPIEDSPFGKAKSWVKGLEACARGIPFIASDHEEYRKLGVGRLVQHPEDWVRHLEELQDPEVYAAECKINRARAEELSITRHWKEWDALLREAATLVSGTRLPSKASNVQHKQHMDIGLTAEYEQRLTEIPSATTLNERKLMLHYTAAIWDGRGDVFENGPLLGGSTRALALGMLANEHRHPDTLLHTYDWFSFVEPLDLTANAFGDLIDAGLLTQPQYDSACYHGTFHPIFQALHANQDYSPLIRSHVGYLPNHRDDEAEDGAKIFTAPDRTFSLAFIDGCKSWYGTKHWITELCPHLASGAHVLFQDFGQYTCFWLPMLVGLFEEHFNLVAYVDHTYALTLTKPITPDKVAERFPDEPTDLARDEYDRVFDFLIAHAEYREDAFGMVALACQRAAAYAYIGMEDAARVILDGLLDRPDLVAFREYVLRARQSPTYTPEGPILLVA